MLWEIIGLTWKKIFRTNWLSVVFAGFIYFFFLYLIFAEGYPEQAVRNLGILFPLVAVLLSSGLGRDEFDSRQIEPFLSRVKISTFFWGKFLGVLSLLSVALLTGLMTALVSLAIHKLLWAVGDILRTFIVNLPAALYITVLGFFLAMLLKGVQNFAAMILIMFVTIVSVGFVFRAEHLLETENIIKLSWESVLLLLFLPVGYRAVLWQLVLMLMAAAGFLCWAFLIFRSAACKNNLVFAEEGSNLKVCLLVSGLRKSYREGLFGRKKKEALKGVDFSLKPGKLTAFLGPNGAGKTTALRIILNFLKPESGRVVYFPERPEASSRQKLKVGYLQETASLFPFLTVRETFYYIIRNEGPAAKEAAQLTVSQARKLGLEEYLDRRIEALSKGTVQKVAFGLATIGQPEILIFDEPYTGLDPLIMYEMRKLILELKEKGTTIFLSSHLLPEVEKVCDELIFINRGKIVWAGEIEKLKTAWRFYQAAKNNPGLVDRLNRLLGRDLRGQPFSFFARLETGRLVADQALAAALKEIPVPEIEKIFLEIVLNS